MREKRFRSQGVGSCHVTSRAGNAESSHVTFGCGICRNSREEAEVDAVGKMKQKQSSTFNLLNEFVFTRMSSKRSTKIK